VKHTQVLPGDSGLGDRKNMIYSGTHLTAGRGRAVMVATGLQTEVGKIARMTATAEEPKTPLEQRLHQFGQWLVIASIVLFALVLAFGLMRGIKFVDIFMVAISQWFNVLNCRSALKSSLNLDVLRNAWLVSGLLLANLLHLFVIYSETMNRIFHTVPIPLTDFFLLGLIGSSVLWAEEIRKFFARRRNRLNEPSHPVG